MSGMKLLSVYMDPPVSQAWRAAVKLLNMKQGPAMDEALRDFMKKHAARIAAASNLPPVKKAS